MDENDHDCKDGNEGLKDPGRRGRRRHEEPCSVDPFRGQTEVITCKQLGQIQTIRSVDLKTVL